MATNTEPSVEAMGAMARLLMARDEAEAAVDLALQPFMTAVSEAIGHGIKVTDIEVEHKIMIHKGLRHREFMNLGTTIKVTL